MKRARSGFTIVELLVVIAIIAVLGGILITAVSSARGKARMSACTSHLKNFSTAIDNYKAFSEQQFPPYLSVLYDEYYEIEDGYICPSDWSEGEHGGIADKVKNTETKFMPDEQYEETDDTEFNDGVNLEGRPYQDFRNPEITRCSYLYEFSIADCDFEDALPDETWCEYKKRQMKQKIDGQIVAGHVPIVRCFWHTEQKKDGSSYQTSEPNVLNIGVGHRGVYRSRPKWEDDV
jgi:prepilin-type N-terminal cleavage/methylation domain-containing protein